ncbi:MAG: sugar phosphate isomerase/epimerase [Lachnospiraceae bacterium]|nr:sugar phosphate isomerase/epimerase [Lachnospiraceae bacterium]
MQTGIRLHDSAKGSIEERAAAVSAQGFQCVHIALSKLYEDKKYSADSALTPGYAMYLKKVFEEKNLDIAVLGCYLNLANPNPGKLTAIQERYMAHIRFASHLCCGVVGTETGAPNEEYKAVPECHGKEALDTFIRNLAPVVEYAESMGVLVAIEPVFKHIVWNPDRAREVLKAIASPNLRIIFDPVNLLDLSNYKTQKDVFKDAIDKLHDDIAVVHLKDYLVEDAGLKSVGAGKGCMEYEEILTFIAKEKPYIHVTLENTTPETAVWSKQYIQDIYERVRTGESK